MRKEQALYIYNIHHPTHSTTSQLALSSNEGFFATSKSRTSVHPSTLGFPIRLPNEASYWHGTERKRRILCEWRNDEVRRYARARLAHSIKNRTQLIYRPFSVVKKRDTAGSFSDAVMVSNHENFSSSVMAPTLSLKRTFPPGFTECFPFTLY